MESVVKFNQFLTQGRKDFRNCVFLLPFRDENELLTQKLTDSSYDFSGSVFVTNLWFKKIRIDGSITLFDITFKKPVIFNLLECTDNFTISSCTFHDIEFLSSPIKKLTLIDNKFLGKFRISQGYEKKSAGLQYGGDVKKIQIEELFFINNTIATETLVVFGYLDVNLFYFTNIYNPINSEINIGKCDFNNFYIYNIRNSGRFRIYEINTNKEGFEAFVLVGSSLGDSEFYNVNLKCYEKSFCHKIIYSRD